MKFVVFILGLSSIFATCKKSTTVTLDGTKSKNYKTAEWKQVSGNGTIIAPNRITSKIIFSKTGTNYILLTVKDSLGRTATDIKKITVIK